MPGRITAGLIREARVAAEKSLALGEIEVHTLDGIQGVWARAEGQRFFVPLSLAAQAIPIDSDDPADDQLWWLDGDGDPCQAVIDMRSGRIKNWSKICGSVKREPTKADRRKPDVIELAEQQVKTYRRADGTLVRAHRRHTNRIKRFLGIAKATKGAKGHENDVGKEFHVYEGKDRFVGGKNLGSQRLLVDPKTGELAPPGTETGPEDSYRGENLTGYRMTPQFASKTYDTSKKWESKISEIVAMSQSEDALRLKVQSDLKAEGWPLEKRCAIVVVLQNRHVFRIGGEGTKSNVAKGKRDPEGKAAPAVYDDTYGITTLRPEHLVIGPKTVMFHFTGKSGVEWKTFETDPLIAGLVRQLRDEADGAPVFGVTADDVRDYLRPFGFKPHRFRTYWASYIFYRTVREATRKLKTGIRDKKARVALVKKACEAAAEKLNDTVGAAKTHYILPSMIDEVLQRGSLSEHPELRELQLNESEFTWWLPDELEFQNMVALESYGQQPTVSLVEVLLGPWPPLEEGDHWVTLKPNGPDSDSYVRVIIREHPDGSAHVVWAGNKGLEHLRLSRVGSEDKIKKEEKIGPGRPLTPEEKQLQSQKRAERSQLKDKEREAFGQAVLSAIGGKGDPAEIAKALLARHLRPPDAPDDRTPEEIELERQKIEAKAAEILAGRVPEVLPAPDPGAGVPPDRALAEASVADMIGEMPHALSGVSPELQEAWNTARLNPDVMAQVAGMISKHRERVREINKEIAGPKGTLRVMNRMAFYSEPSDNELALLDEADSRVRYQLNSRFWHLNSGGSARGADGTVKDEPGLGIGVQEYFFQGATDALTTIGDRFSIGKRVNPGVLQELGPEVVAAALADDISRRGETIRLAAAQRIEQDIAKNALPAVSESLAIAEDADRQRMQIRAENESQLLTDVARVNALKNQTVRKQKALGRAAGSLEAAAAVADFLRRGKQTEGITIQAGEKLDVIRDRLEQVGLVEGHGYELQQGGAGGGFSIHIAQDDLPKLMQVVDNSVKRDDEIRRIKSHKANTKDFEVPGLVLFPGETIQDSQQACIRYAEHEKTSYINAGVGLGKTLIAGSIIARAIARGDAKNALYICPTNNIAGTLTELRRRFPNLTVAAAHTELNENLRTKQDRRKLYTDPNRPQILLIGQDTVRNDADILADVQSGPDAAGVIIGDEVHGMFTPGDSETPEEQSQRSRALLQLRAPMMTAMTGTTIRRSAAEPWKVFNWLRPGSRGPLSSWLLRYGKIGQGVSAFSAAVDEAFRKEIDDIAITEKVDPKTKLTHHVRVVPLSDIQSDAYRAEQAKYEAVSKKPGADRRRLSALKSQRQRDAVYTAGGATDNHLLRALMDDALPHMEAGERGIIHCTSLRAVDAVAKAFKPGVLVTYTGDDSLSRRDAIVGAINDGTLITGGRAKALDGTQGVLTQVGTTSATMRTDDGQTKTFPLGDLGSAVLGVVGTSTATGVLSTGLNLQRGSNWTAHFQLADSAATQEQRDARNFRTGQKKDVESYIYVADTPASREHWQKLQEQEKLKAAFDDPTDYDEHDLFQLDQDKELAEKAPRDAHLGETGPIIDACLTESPARTNSTELDRMHALLSEFDEQKHPRVGKGHSKESGEFAKKEVPDEASEKPQWAVGDYVGFPSKRHRSIMGEIQELGEGRHVVRGDAAENPRGFEPGSRWSVREDQLQRLNKPPTKNDPQLSVEAVPTPSIWKDGEVALPGIHSASYGDKDKYTDEVVSILIGHDGEELWNALGLKLAGHGKGPGFWLADSQYPQINPSHELRFESATPEQLDKASAALGIVLHQQGVGWETAFPESDPQKANGHEVMLSRPWTEEDVDRVYGILLQYAPDVRDSIFHTVDSERLRFVKYESKLDGVKYHEAITKAMIAAGLPVTGQRIYGATSRLIDKEGTYGEASYAEALGGLWADHGSDEAGAESDQEAGADSGGRSPISSAIEHLHARIRAVRVKWARDCGWGDPAVEARLCEIVLLYNPSEPRMPKGTSEGGRWTSFGRNKTLKAARAFPNSKLRTPVYHGSAEYFERYDLGKAGSNTGARTAVMGAFFTADPYVSKRFAGAAGHNRIAYLNIRKPFTLFETPLLTIEPSPGIRQLVRRADRDSRFGLVTQDGYEIDTHKMREYGDAFEQMQRAVASYEKKEVSELTALDYLGFVDRLKRNGYDSIMLKDAVADGEGRAHTTWIVFDPEDIAFGGEVDPTVNGLVHLIESHFDPNEPRIPKGAPGGGQWTKQGAFLKPSFRYLHAAADRMVEEYSRMNVDPEQRSALGWYCANGYHQINSYMQGKELRKDIEVAARETAETMQCLIDSFSIDEPLKAFRGEWLPPNVIEQLKPGAVIEDKRFLSTTVDPRKAAMFAGVADRVHGDQNEPGRVCICEIAFPKGHHVIPVSPTFTSRRGLLGSEMEYIGTPNAKYRVVHVGELPVRYDMGKDDGGVREMQAIHIKLEAI